MIGSAMAAVNSCDAAPGAGGGGGQPTDTPPGCGRAPLSGKTGCDAACAGLTFVAAAGICTGCEVCVRARDVF